MKKSKIISTGIIIFIMFMIIQSKSFAVSVENVLENVEYTKEYVEWLNLPDEEKKNTIMPGKYDINTNNDTDYYSTSFALRSSLNSRQLMSANEERYNLREHITISVKDQGSTGQCWALSANSVIETNIEKTTGEVSPLFSARYIEYATSRTFTDGINPIAYNRELNNGGFAEIAMGLYTSGNGPVLESDLPFEDNSYKISLSQIQNLETQKQLKSYQRFPKIYKSYTNNTVTYTDASGNEYTDREVNEIRNQIKQHIVKYGAIISQTYGVGTNGTARVYYNNPINVKQSTAYFCNNASAVADHQITIIGWDDDYKVNNFDNSYRTSPQTPGAYIVLNSWGEDFGESGVYYVSYEDTFIERDLLGIISTTDIEYDNIYQHDELGNNHMISSAVDVYGANVFERNESSESEWLTEISLSSLIDFSCEIYINPTSGELDLDKCTKVADEMRLKNGYHTIELDKPLKLTGDEFAVIVKYIVDGTGKAYFGLEHPDQYNWATATAQRGESYISMDSENWEDILDLASSSVVPSNSNLCIKAFTEYNLIKEYFEVNNYGIDNEYIYNISPKTKIRDFIENISTNMEYSILDSNGNSVTDDQLCATGMQVVVGEKTYKIVVLGDLNGNGKVTVTDVVQGSLHLVNINRLSDLALKAFDVNKNGKETITDLTIINLASVNLRQL